MRLLYHGHLHLAMREWYLYFSASRNPYDTTERMQWEWKQAKFDWTNGMWMKQFPVSVSVFEETLSSLIPLCWMDIIFSWS